MFTQNVFNHQAHLEPPPFANVFSLSFIIPFVAYSACFRLASLFVKSFMWESYTGFKAYRLQNLTICLLHSLITGTWATTFLITHTKEMLEDIIHWYEPWAAQLPIISIAYFVHDAFDMLNHEISRWTMELLFHHIATCLALLIGVLPQKFLLATYWALLMEFNSIFLHARTIMQISKLSLSQPDIYRVVVQCNVVSFVLCRFVAQAIFSRWVTTQIDRMHFSYVCVALGGGAVFMVINVMLFFRVLVADGFLSQRWRKNVAINRDDDNDGGTDKLKNGKSD